MKSIALAVFNGDVIEADVALETDAIALTHDDICKQYDNG